MYCGWAATGPGHSIKPQRLELESEVQMITILPLFMEPLGAFCGTISLLLTEPSEFCLDGVFILGCALSK